MSNAKFIVESSETEKIKKETEIREKKDTKKIKQKNEINSDIKKIKKDKNVDPDKFAVDLIELMKKCYSDDLNRDKNNFELQKLKHLNEITNKLLNANYQEKCLYHGCLEEIKIWLEPLPDNSLPNTAIKKSLLETLYMMENITRSDLINSQIGKIVHFYSKNPRESMEIRRVAKQCITKWKGMIIAEEQEERML